MRISKSNLPQDVPLRWNVEKAAAEFGLSIMTLRKALNKNSAAPDQDGLYTTRQIGAAVYGGALSEEKLRTQRQITERYTLENQITRGEMLNRAELSKAFAAIADAFVSRVMTVQGLSRQEKEDLLRELSSWPLALEDVAHAQSRLPRRGKGKRNGDGDDGSEE
jgi:hypothetical protein